MHLARTVGPLAVVDQPVPVLLSPLAWVLMLEKRCAFMPTKDMVVASGVGWRQRSARLLHLLDAGLG